MLPAENLQVQMMDETLLRAYLSNPEAAPLPEQGARLAEAFILGDAYALRQKERSERGTLFFALALLIKKTLTIIYVRRILKEIDIRLY